MRGLEIIFLRILIVCLLLAPIQSLAADRSHVVIGSKKFTESVILGEILSRLARSTKIPVRHRREIGGTRMLWGALLKGDIDAYVEYTGTLAREVFAAQKIRQWPEIKAALARHNILVTEPLGFNNTYAVGVHRDIANQRNIKVISDLKNHPDLPLGFSNEFMDRGDGWRGLKKHYGLPQKNVRGLDHDLAYRGVKMGDLAGTDVYITDANIAYYNLVLLNDDRKFFPDYQAVVLYRADLVQRAPDVAKNLHRIEGVINAPAMREMNMSVKFKKVTEKKVAAGFLQEKLNISLQSQAQPQKNDLWSRLRKTTIDHLLLVAISLSAAIAVAVPLGIVAARRPRLGQVILSMTGIIQTIPTLALFVFMIPLLGIGGPPAVVALFLYSLLPIVRNTHAGLANLTPSLADSAQALGLPSNARLRLIELPLAGPSILAGIKTSAVINVGTATLGALIGAGGYGQPILTGIRLDDIGLILEGAIPAALLALIVQSIFEGAERYFVPKGLRLKPTQ